MLRKASREAEVNVWRKVSRHLDKSKRRRVVVNLSRINRYTQPREVVVIPGKALGAGTLTHPVTVAAYAFSPGAMLKIKEAGGESLTIEELLRRAPKGSNVILMG